MKKPLFRMNTEHVLGWVGLFLLIVVTKLAERAYGPQQTLAHQVSSWTALRAIDLVGVIGWLADRLPEPTVVTPAVLPTSTRTTGGVRA
jgi:hypothetical protein